MGKRMMSEAKRRANKKWNDANLNVLYDHLHLVVPKGRRKDIKAYAESKRVSINALINMLLQKEMNMSDEQWKTTNEEE